MRLGSSIGKLSDEEKDALIANKTQWIDVTAAQRRKGTFLGHSYFHDNPWVSSDLRRRGPGGGAVLTTW